MHGMAGQLNANHSVIITLFNQVGNKQTKTMLLNFQKIYSNTYGLDRSLANLHIVSVMLQRSDFHIMWSTCVPSFVLTAASRQVCILLLISHWAYWGIGLGWCATLQLEQAMRCRCLAQAG